jgi:hypothetical protein
MIFGPGWWLILPALGLLLLAQWKVRSAYQRWSQVPTRSGMTGADVARAILREHGILESRNPMQDKGLSVGLEAVAGEMTDHYDPSDRVLRLSEGVYNGRSIAALGIAAHEVGHAIQHANSYGPLVLRSALYPLSALGSNLGFYLFFIGLLITAWTGVFPWLPYVGILLFAVAVFFTVVTLPVEFNASSRALKALSSGGYLTEDEMGGARSVLNAAAMTYVASTAIAVTQLIQMLLLARR